VELFLLILAIFFLYKGVRALRRHSAVRKQGEDEPAPGAVRIELPRGAPAQWFGADKTPEVNGWSIPGGLVYIGGKLLDFNDPCLINTDLKTEPGVSPQYPVEDSFPDYGKLSPGQRGAYLSWLSKGRSDPSADIAYVFLFFYGLERRLLIDGQRRLVSAEERGEIVRELLRLLPIYGENRGFRGYCRNLLAVEWVLYGKPDEQPPYVDFSDRYCAEPFAAVLARYAAAEEPIPPDTALQWLILNPEHGLKTAARRCPDLFRKLFAVRYREKFGDGMIIRSTKTSLTLTYKAASPSLGDRLRLRIPGLPNPRRSPPSPAGVPTNWKPTAGISPGEAALTRPVLRPFCPGIFLRKPPRGKGCGDASPACAEGKYALWTLTPSSGLSGGPSRPKWT